jgi:integrase
MPRKVRDKDIESRTAWAKLRGSGKPYWRALSPGLHLGYRKGQTGGRWVVRWYVGGQSYKVETLPGVADDHANPDGSGVLDFGQAQEAARHLYSVATQRTGQRGTPQTVAQAVASYVDWLRDHAKTATDTEWRLNRHVVPLIGDRLVSDLGADDIERVQRTMVRRDPDDPDVERRSKDTANRIMKMLRAALTRTGVPSGPWRSVQLFRKVARPREVHLDAAQAKRLINTCDGALRKLVTAGLLTGARLGEIVSLRVRHFRGDLGTLSVVDRRPRNRVRDPDALLLPRDDGGRWLRGQHRLPFTAAVKRAKLPADTVFYSLRHTYASAALVGGGDRHLANSGCNQGSDPGRIERANPVASSDGARDMAKCIPEAHFVELPGNTHSMQAIAPEKVLVEIQALITGARPAPVDDRMLATALVVDVANSTQALSALGGRAWKIRLEDCYRIVRNELARYRGRETDTAGDGFVARFDGPSRAIECALSITSAVKPLGASRAIGEKNAFRCSGASFLASSAAASISAVLKLSVAPAIGKLL